MMKANSQSLSSVSSNYSLLPQFTNELVSEAYLSNLNDCLSAITHGYYESQSELITGDIDKMLLQLSIHLQWIDLIRPILQHSICYLERMKKEVESNERCEDGKEDWDGIQASIAKCQSLLKTEEKKNKEDHNPHVIGPVNNPIHDPLAPYTSMSNETIQLIREVILQLPEQDEGENNRTLPIQFIIQTLLDHAAEKSTVFLNVGNPDTVDGVFEINSYTIQFRKVNTSKQTSFYQLIIADNNQDENGKKRMVVLAADSTESELVEMDCSGMRENVIIDLNREGRRWEGGELNGKPFGFGVEYSEDGNLVYEGFVFEGKKVCVGKEFNDNGNNNCLVYEGGYCNGKHWGEGKSYDLHEEIISECKWMNNGKIAENTMRELMQELTVAVSIEKFVSGDEFLNDIKVTSLRFSPLLCRLKQIEIGKNCFMYVREFELNGLINLESVKIGEKSFIIGDEERPDGFASIENCPKLNSLITESYSFKDYKSFILSRVDSLKSIKIGENSFMFADCILKCMWFDSFDVK